MFGRRVPGQSTDTQDQQNQQTMAAPQMAAMPIMAQAPQPARLAEPPRMAMALNNPTVNSMNTPAQTQSRARVLDMGGARPRSASESKGDRRLTVGCDITLTGEIATCDVLMVEGQVEATLKDSKLIEISETGTFRGVVEVEQAKIAGRFEGDLFVRGRLTVCDTGRVVGQVRYGELEVMPGGQIVGDMQMMQQASASSTSSPASFRTSTARALEMEPDQKDHAEEMRAAG